MTAHDEARPVAPEKLDWVCNDCAYSGPDWRYHTEWESGHVDDVICGRCGSPDTDAMEDTSISAIAETIKKERTDYEALRAEVERLREDRNALRSTVAEQEMRLGNEIDRAEAAEASLDDFIEATEHYFNTGETAPLRAALNDQGQGNG